MSKYISSLYCPEYNHVKSFQQEQATDYIKRRLIEDLIQQEVFDHLIKVKYDQVSKHLIASIMIPDEVVHYTHVEKIYDTPELSGELEHE